MAVYSIASLEGRRRPSEGVVLLVFSEVLVMCRCGHPPLCLVTSLPWALVLTERLECVRATFLAILLVLGEGGPCYMV